MGAVKLKARVARKNPRNTVDRLFADAFGPWPSLFRRTSWYGWRPIFDQPEWQRQALSAPTDLNSDPEHQDVILHETPQALTIEITLPTVNKKSLSLEIEDHFLIISAESNNNEPAKTTRQDKMGPLTHFRRRIQLPNVARPGAIQARLNGNKLIIRITKDNECEITDNEQNNR